MMDMTFQLIALFFGLILMLIPVFILARLAEVIKLLKEINDHLAISNHEQTKIRRESQSKSETHIL